jgi:hypothetical protein
MTPEEKEAQKLAAYHAELEAQKIDSDEQRLASLTDAEFDAAYAQLGRNPNRPVRDVIGPRLADLRNPVRSRKFTSTTEADRATFDPATDPVNLDNASFEAGWRALGSRR